MRVGREQRRSGCERVEFTLSRRGAAVAATNDPSAGAMCNRCDTARIREFGARGRAVREVRAAMSVRRAGVMPKCAVGLPRAAGGCEGTDGTLGHAGGALCWSRPATFASL
jgi:hypothetical protein